MTDESLDIRPNENPSAPAQPQPPRKPKPIRDRPLDENELYVREVAKLLKERNGHAIHQIRLLVQYWGRANVQAAVDEVLQIEASGGMMTSDGSRRRTPGGVFFYIIRPKMSAYQQSKVFGKVLAILRPKAPPFPRERTLKLVKAALKNPVEVGESVRILLLGRPEEVKRDGEVCVIAMQNTQRPQSIPLKLPAWPDEPTTYVVYMLAEHWDKVEQTLKLYPESKLFVDGQCALDRELGQIVVYAQQLSLRGMPNVSQKTVKKRAAKVAAEAEAAQAEGGQPDGSAPAAAPKRAKPSKADKAAAKIEALEKAAQEAQEKLDAIRALPSNHQQGLFTAMREVQRIRTELEQARAQAAKK